MISALINVPEINPELFTYEKYSEDWLRLFDNDFAKPLTLKKIVKLIKENAIGYCDGSRLTIKPSPRVVAIMFEKDNEQFWFHVGKLELNKFN